MTDRPEKPQANELAAFVAALWAKRWWVIIGASISAAAAVVAVLVRTPQYEATARMAVVEFYVADATPNNQQRQTYAEIIRSQTVAQGIVEKHDLGEELGISATDLLERVSVQLVGGTSLIELAVELPAPQLALDVALDLATGAEDLTKMINDADRVRARGVLDSQFQQAAAEVERIESEVADSGGAAALRALGRELDIYLDRKQALEEDWLALFLTLEEQKSNAVADRLNAAKASLIAVTRERRPQALEAELRETLLQWTTFRTERDRVSARLSGERARLAQAEAELALKDPVLELTRTLGDDALLVETQRGRQAESPTPLTLTSEYVNPVFEEIELTVAATRFEVEALEKQLAELERLVEEYADRAESLEGDLAEAESAVETQSRTADLALDEYNVLYEKAPAGARAALDVIERELTETEGNISDVQARLAARDALVQRLDAEYEASLRVRSDLRARLESSEVTVAGQLAELMLVDPPILPEKTSNTSALLVIIAGAMLGTLLSLLLAAFAAGLEAVPPAD